MATRKKQADEATEQEAYEQKADERGRTRLDRPHTSAEAQAQDAHNAERLAEERRARFEGRVAE